MYKLQKSGCQSDYKSCDENNVNKATEQQPQPEQNEQKEPTLTDKRTDKLLYSLEETPPWYLCILLGLQVGYRCKCILLLR